MARKYRNDKFAFVERSRTMKAPVGLLSGRTVLRSKMEGLCPDKFTFVEVIKGCIMEIEYKQTKDFTADELQETVRSTEHGCKLYQ